jgi:hypothetical protein
MDDARAERLAMNEALFRELNEMIKEGQDERRSFLCECIKVSCQLRLSVSDAEYETVRAHPARFFVYPGHEEPGIEAVVEDLSPRYLIIEKVDPGRQVAEERAR